MTLSVAIIGAGPAGFYAAESLLDVPGVRIDIIERLPTPFGLIRAGVAPDHQSTKQVVRRFEQTALQDIVHFYGNVEIGRAVDLDELRGFYDAVVLAVGAGLDRPLDVPGERLDGVYGSASFVGWYNGHPDFRDLAPRLGPGPAVVIGNGNVALDVARVLVKSEVEMATSDLPDFAREAIRAGGIADVFIVGRRGAADAKFTRTELREIGALEACDPIIDPDDIPAPAVNPVDRDGRLREKTLAVLRGLAVLRTVKPKRLHFRFHRAPVAIEGDDAGAVRAVQFAGTQMKDGRIVATDMIERIACSFVVAAIGYRTGPIAGIPFDADRGLFPSDDGRIAPGVYAVGWAKRGPTGVIGSNRPDGTTCAEQIAADAPVLASRGLKPGRAAFEACMRARGVRTITFDDWRKIDAAEIAGADQLAPRRKFTSLGEMLAVLAESGKPICGPVPRAVRSDGDC
ncbi:MAG: FAD-dependent oxidoreductase [Rhodospirillales bacterium]|nr:FAD-dependent oxidoreductase [Rhodospirillales bacterium]